MNVYETTDCPSCGLPTRVGIHAPRRSCPDGCGPVEVKRPAGAIVTDRSHRRVVGGYR